MARRRPWRAVAFIPDATAPNGRQRKVAGRTSACTPDGLAAFQLRHRWRGHVIQVFRVSELPVD